MGCLQAFRGFGMIAMPFPRWLMPLMAVLAPACAFGGWFKHRQLAAVSDKILPH